MENSEHIENWRTRGILYLVGLHLVCAGEQWRILSTWRTGERGILYLASWVTFIDCAGEQWRILSTWRTGEHGILSSWVT